MIVRIPSVNWHIELVEAIKIADTDDVIIVKSLAQKELGERARNRICPDKKITFETSV